MADNNWANTREKRILYARAEAFGASTFTLSFEESVQEFLQARNSLTSSSIEVNEEPFLRRIVFNKNVWEMDFPRRLADPEFRLIQGKYLIQVNCHVGDIRLFAQFVVRHAVTDECLSVLPILGPQGAEEYFGSSWRGERTGQLTTFLAVQVKKPTPLSLELLTRDNDSRRIFGLEAIIISLT